MTYHPLPMGWKDTERRIHAYLFVRGPKTAAELVDALDLYPDAPRYTRLHKTYRHLKRMKKWGYAFRDKDMSSGKIYWHYAYDSEPQIYVNPSYVHKEE